MRALALAPSESYHRLVYMMSIAKQRIAWFFDAESKGYISSYY